jgi:hypothetical protein
MLIPLYPNNNGGPMPQHVLMDQFHLSFFVPRNLSAAESAAIRQTLDDTRFRAALKIEVQQVVARFPSLNKTRLRMSQ